jgi:phytoene dehydrogenase-like protein
MSKSWDVAIIGGGHNGLTAATLLARRGKKVVVLERRDHIGGLAVSEEFAPGYRTAGVLQQTRTVRPWVVKRLDLESHGLELRKEPLPLLIPTENGPGYLHWRDPERAASELSASDGDRYRRFRAFLRRLAPLVSKILDEPPADLEELDLGDLWAVGRKALTLRLLGREDMMEVFRIAPMCVADWLREWFEAEILSAALAGEAVTHGVTGPWSPGTTLNLILGETQAHNGVTGGPAALLAALEKAAHAAGVEVRTGAGVKALELHNGTVSGAILENDELVQAGQVAAACDPKTLFLELIPSTHLPLEFEREISLYRARGTAARVDLALGGYPEFTCRPEFQAPRIRTGTTLDELERAFDAVKYRQIPEAPVLEVFAPTIEDPELAPAGHHVFSILVHWVPYELEGGWRNAQKEALLDRVLDTLARYAPNIRELTVDARVQSPVDLESDYAVSGGHLLHGEHSADQLLTRPTSECVGYRTPFPGLYLCGSGSHPGGGITCAPGALAAQTILKG